MPRLFLHQCVNNLFASFRSNLSSVGWRVPPNTECPTSKNLNKFLPVEGINKAPFSAIRTMDIHCYITPAAYTKHATYMQMVPIDWGHVADMPMGSQTRKVAGHPNKGTSKFSIFWHVDCIVPRAKTASWRAVSIQRDSNVVFNTALFQSSLFVSRVTVFVGWKPYVYKSSTS